MDLRVSEVMILHHIVFVELGKAVVNKFEAVRLFKMMEDKF